MNFEIANFRSIKQQRIELAPITVVYGPNGAGKSSLLYALLTMKNVVVNPNQSPDGFFNYVFVNLGGFEAVVFDHQTRKDVHLRISFDREGVSLGYEVVIGSSKGALRLSVEGKEAPRRKMELPISFPYPANQQIEQTFAWRSQQLKATWNGITAQAQVTSQDQQSEADQLVAYLNAPVEILRTTSMVPLKRGFSKPHYSAVSVSPMVASEDEVATSLSMDKYLISRVSHYLEQIVGRDFRVNTTPGTAMFSLDATDRKTGVAAELVNDGFGVNQLVHLLAMCLHKDSEWVCIEEPEIHLHPKAVHALAEALVRIVRDDHKQFVISTHSESLVVAFLGLVASGEISPGDIACYLTCKEGRETRFERQVVKENGQIEGGLGAFIETQLADIRQFMQIKQ